MRKSFIYPAMIWSVSLSVLVTGCQSPGAQAPTKEGAAAPEAAKPKPLLKLLANYDGLAKPETDSVVKDMEKLTGYKVQYSMLPADNSNEKLNIEVASGADYDIVRLNATQFRMLVKQNALLPLDDLLSKHGNYLKEGILPETWDLTRVDGKIYGIPKKNERLNIAEGLAVRQDLLDSLGLKMPATLDEFYTVLKTIKEKNKDAVPLTINNGSGKSLVPTIMSAFGLYTPWTDVNGTLVPLIKMPKMKEYIAFMTKLYNEGLLDKDFPINKAANAIEKFSSGKASVIPYDWTGSTSLVDATLKTIPAAKINTIMPLQGKNGELGIPVYAKLVEVTAILKSSKKAEDAIKFMDAKMEPKTFQMLALGEEGVTFKKEGDKYLAIMPALSDLRGSASWYLNGVREKEYADMWLARLRRTPVLYSTYEAMNKDYSKYAINNISGFMPPLDSVNKYETALGKLFDDYLTQALVGGEKPENFEAFIAKWDKEGGVEMAKEINDWYKNGGKESVTKMFANYPRG